MPQIVYIMDSDCFINLHRHYPSDVFQGLWRELNRLVQSGRLIAPVEVLNEIKKRDDTLLQWARINQNIFKNLDTRQIEKVKEILARFPTLTDPSKETPDADPFVIALATAEESTCDGTLFPYQYVVVTEEKSGTGKKKAKIPDVCSHYGIECIPLLGLFRREEWTF